MNWSTWFRRSDRKDTTSNQHQQEEDEESLGVTQQLIDHIKSFTVDAFKNFPLQDEEERTSGANFSDEIVTSASVNVRKDLSLWQERHATLVLSRVKELSQLRFLLCPRHLKEREFWRIYFTLVKSHLTEYELQAVRLAKLKKMATENETSSDSNAFEVEMAETNQATSAQPLSP